MFLRRASKHRESLRLLVKLIATEKDRHQLISKVACDVRLIREVQGLFLNKQPFVGAGRNYLFKLCRLCEISPDFFQERIRLIVYVLNLVEHQEDYYRELGVERGASVEEIKHAFRQLSLAYHPDRGCADSKCFEKYLKMVRAYEVLSSEQLRKQYDKHVAMPAWREDTPWKNPQYSPPWTQRLRHNWELVILVGLLSILSLLIDYPDWLSIKHHNGMRNRDSVDVKLSGPKGLEPGGITGSKAKESEIHAAGASVGEGRERPAPITQDRSGQNAVLQSPPSKTSNKPPVESSVTDQLVPVKSLNNATDSSSLESSQQGGPVHNVNRLGTSSSTSGEMDVNQHAAARVSPPEGAQTKDISKLSKGLSSGSVKLDSNGQKGNASRASASGQQSGRSVDLEDTEGNGSSEELAARRRLESEGRIQVFLNRYVHAYEQRNVGVLMSLFEPDARENGELVRDLAPVYRERLTGAERVQYRIRLLKWYSSESGIEVNARAHVVMYRRGESAQESDGFLHLRLVERGKSFRVKSLNYSF